jgi:ATP-binding cassette subfamily F protein uup
MEQEDKKQLAKDNLSVIKKPQLPIKKKVSFYEQKEYASVAKEIEEVEEKLKALTLQLNSDAQNHDELSKIAKKIKGLNIELEQKTNRWIELAELIES